MRDAIVQVATAVLLVVAAELRAMHRAREARREREEQTRRLVAAAGRQEPRAGLQPCDRSCEGRGGSSGAGAELGDRED